MLYLITGTPGHGKSLFAVDMIQKFVDENKQLEAKGEKPRPIYADIDGLIIPGVQESPDDWRTLPDGSIVVYDECQQRFGPDGQGRSSRGDIQEMETHRHRGFDIILITQHPKLLHSHIRRLIGRHYHVFRMYGTNTAKIFSRDGQMDIDKPAYLEKQDNFAWQYPKQHFDKYKSATQHTHKRRLPAWMKRSMLGALVAIPLVAFLFYQAIPFFTGSNTAEIVQEEIQPKSVNASQGTVRTVATREPLQTKREPEPVACIASDTACRCYDKDGQKISMPFQQCQNITTTKLNYLDFYIPGERRAAASAPRNEANI